MSAAAALADIQSTVTSGSLLLAAGLALAAGLISFLSPCVLPLVPGYLSYVATSAGEAGTEPSEQSKPARRRVVIGALLFVLGFTAVFVSYGALFGQAGAQLRRYEDVITRVMGVFVIAMGIAFLGKLPFMQREWRIHRLPVTGLVGAPLLGAFFAIGWTPCIGPTLASILTLSYNEADAGRGAVLATVYSLGLGVPFVLIALGAGWAMRASAFFRRHSVLLMRIGGVTMILLGLALVTGLWQAMMIELQGWFATTGVVI
ncbi:cytochrome c biogenesis CcdA family protein [Epidermidibacterium keratini]|uniref:cytochrome c biogenesis CcdA family protein n=1 Tax=Epidermidibacterium keratini TaxID=1891644 RepID=UPI001CEF86A7|nr:cytochrome c biogenesis protein CcdA [Epidermidibacterium keratini]